MTRRNPLITWGAIMLGILAIAASLIFLGDRESHSYPAASSFSPSGSSAFYELLRRSGYQVTVDPSIRPKMGKKDIAIAFLINEDLAGAVIESTRPSRNETPTSFDKVRESLEDHIASDGSVLVLRLDSDYRSVSKVLVGNSHQVVNKKTGKSVRASASGNAPGAAFVGSNERAAEDLWTRKDLPYVQLSDREIGKAATFVDGAIATNRFLDRERNAEVLMDVVATLGPPGSRVVFTEAVFGNAREKSLLAAIGPWAQGAWWQIVFLFAVLIYALGKPFGLAESFRRKERGARELLDAIGDTYQRGRMTRAVLDSTQEEAERLLLRWSRTPTEQLDGTPQAVAYGKLKLAMARLDAAKDMKPSESEALELAKDVERWTRELSDAGGRSRRAS